MSFSQCENQAVSGHVELAPRYNDYDGDFNSISAEKNSTVIFPLPIGLIMVRMKMIMIDDTRCWGYCVTSDGDYGSVILSLVIPFCFRSCDKPDGELACWI